MVGGRPDVVRLASRLFGGHVARRAQDRVGAGLARIVLQPLYESEVGDLERAVGGQQDIGRFEVTMDDFLPVRDAHRATEDFDDPRGLDAGLRLARDLLREVPPLRNSSEK